MSKFILAIDEGTTGVTASITELTTLKFVGKVNREFPQIFPHPGWVEHDLNHIWQCTKRVIRQVLKKCSIEPQQIACMGITNQRETVGAFTRKGVPLGHAIVWQDRRTTKFCEQLSAKAVKMIRKRTGLTADPYFSGPKIKWLMENTSKVQEAAERDNLFLGTLDTFLLYKFSGGTAYKTDASNASRTMLYNIKRGQWDGDLLQLFGVKEKFLPTVCDSFGEFGQTKGLEFLPDGIPITGILGDQQAALLGQGGAWRGDIKCTYGTGAFLLLNTGTKKVNSKSGLLTTVAYRHKGQNIFALEGSCYIAGAAIQWLRDQLNIIESSLEVERLAGNIQDLSEMKFVSFLPFFTGIASPYWQPNAKGAIVGITRDSDRAHIARACLDGVAFSVQNLISACEKDWGSRLSVLRVDGGMCQNNLFCQIQSNVSNFAIRRPQIIETSTYGASLAAAIGLGEKTFGDIEKLHVLDREFTPNQERKFYRKKRRQWNELLKRLYL